MRRASEWLLSVLLCSLPAFGQQQALVRYDNIALTWTYVSGVRVALPIPNASIRVCTANAVGTPCSPTATVYTDPAGQFPAPNPLTADSRGNYGFYAQPGRYIVQISGPAVQMYQMVIDVPLTPPLNLSVSSNITGVLPIANGGTGASTGAGALTNLNAAAAGSCPSGQVMTSASSTGPTCVPLSNLIGPTSLRAPSSTFLCSGPSGSDGLCTMPSSTDQSGATTIAEGFASQPPSVALMGPLVPPGAAVGVVNWGYCFTTQAGLASVSCTATLPAATTAGNALLVMQCSHNNFGGCSNLGNAPTDPQGDTFVQKDNNGLIWYASNIVGGTTSVTCNLPESGSMTNGVAGCIVIELANAAGVDVYSGNFTSDLTCSAGGSCGVTGTITTTTARDTIFVMYAAGHNGNIGATQCAPKSVTVNPSLGVILGGRFDQPNAWPLWVWWATYPGVNAGTYSFSIDTGVNDCPSSASAPTAPTPYMIAIKPASGTAPMAKPTWRYVSAMDVQAGAGNFGSGVTGVGYQIVQSNGTSVFPRATLNFTASGAASVACSDDANNARTNCNISTPTSVIGYGRATLSSNMSLTTGQNTILTVTVTMPSSGCPCRAIISYGLYIGATSSATWDAWVTDGTNIFAQVDGQTTDATQLPLSGSEVTYVTYSNGQSVTFRLIFNLPSGVSAGWTANASPHAGSEPSRLTVAVLPSS